jgi:hypothetical protein
MGRIKCQRACLSNVGKYSGCRCGGRSPVGGVDASAPLSPRAATGNPRRCRADTNAGRPAQKGPAAGRGCVEPEALECLCLRTIIRIAMRPPGGRGCWGISHTSLWAAAYAGYTRSCSDSNSGSWSAGRASVNSRSTSRCRCRRSLAATEMAAPSTTWVAAGREQACRCR